MLRLVEVEGHGRSRGRAQVLVGARDIPVDQRLPAGLRAGRHGVALRLRRRVDREPADARAPHRESRRQRYRRVREVSSFGDGVMMEVPKNVAKHRFNSRGPLSAPRPKCQPIADAPRGEC